MIGSRLTRERRQGSPLKQENKPVQILPGNLIDSLRAFLAVLVLAVPFLSAQEEEPAGADEPIGAGDARAKLRRGDYEGAREDFAALLKVDPDDSAAALGLARAAAATGGWEKALTVLQGAAKWESSTALQTEAGKIRLQTGKLDRAEALFRKALDLDGDNVTALNRLGEVLSLRGFGKRLRKPGTR